MKIAILTMGTLGDVQPYVALGSGLRRAGYDVTLATGTGFAALVEGQGLEYAPLQADALELVQSPESRAALRSPRAALRVLRQVGPTLRRVLEGEWTAARDANAVVYNPKALGGASIAERLGVPAFLALPVPAYSPTRAFPNPLLLSRDLGPLNRATYGPLNRLLALSTRGVVNGWRERTLGLPPLVLLADELRPGGEAATLLYPCSPSVVPPPRDWDANSIATGYWFLDDEGERPLPSGLVEFLGDGPPPVYVGFGQHGGRRPGAPDPDGP